jgi:hypothetical protein
MEQRGDRGQGRKRPQTAENDRRPRIGAATEAGRVERAARLAAEMRANLKKRKAQQRARGDADRPAVKPTATDLEVES